MIIRSLNGLGVVADRKRNIKSGKEFDGYFPKPLRTDPVLSHDGTNNLTIDKLIPEMVKRYSSDTERIAVVLKQPTLEATLKAIWEFVYTYIQYELDSPYEEQIRRPARTWADRKGDCDCYTTFISSVLTNLRIPHYLRMAGYNNTRGYQHIYVVVPKKEGQVPSARNTYFAVDPVLNSFNEEKPYLMKHDRFMGMARGLNGFPIRMLNGGDVAFSNRNNLVYDTIHYSPRLETWALKGLDGGYYIEGNPNKRFIEPLNGVEGLGFIDTAIKVGTTAFKLGKKLFGKKKKGSPAPAPTPAAPAAAPTDMLKSLTALPASVTSSSGDSNEVITKIVAANKANVMSLNTINEGLKSKINTFSSNLSDEIKKVVNDGQSLKDTTTNLKNLAITALNTTANVKQQTEVMATKNNEILDAVKAEQLKADQFRTEQTSTNRITLITLVALGVVLIYIAVKNSSN